MKYCWYCLLIMVQGAFAQSINDIAIQENLISENSELEEEAIFFKRNNNINQMDFNEFVELGVPDSIALSIMQYRERCGHFVSLNELQAVPKMNEYWFYEIGSKVSISASHHRFENILKELKSTQSPCLLIKYEYKKIDGNQATSYNTVTPTNFLRFRSKDIDYYSYSLHYVSNSQIPFHRRFVGHLALFNLKRIPALLIGRYKLSFGQGLVLGGGYFMSKSNETVVGIYKNSKGILPVQTLSPYQCFSGVASTIAMAKNSTATIAISSMNIFAKAVEDSLTDTIYMTNLYGGNSWTDIANHIKNIALNYQYKNRRLSYGVNTLYTNLKIPVQEIDRIYNRYDFSGKENWLTSFYGNLLWHQVHLFGEMAFESKTNSLAGIVGTQISLSHRVDWSFLLRNYQPKFNSIYGNSFRENTAMKNEKGIYSGLKIYLYKKINLQIGVDQFYADYLKYLIDGPSKGYTLQMAFNCPISKRNDLLLQIHQQSKTQNQWATVHKTYFEEERYKIKFHWRWHSIDQKLMMNTRIQTTIFPEKDKKNYGYYIGEECTYYFKKIRLSYKHAYFFSHSFETAQYIYDSDVLYQGRIHPYYRKGQIQYLLLQVKINRNTSLGLKFSKELIEAQQYKDNWLEEEKDTWLIKSQLKIDL